LRKIRSDDISYKKIDELYVAPIEYAEIETTLKENRIVFITGAKEYGKTYTAIKLLWEFFKNGYEPKYMLERSEKDESIDKLLRLTGELRHRVIYLEDPVGKTDYIPNEKFENNIRRVIDVLDQEEVHIIITMREEIYKKFQPTGKGDILKLVKQLNIQQQSYDYDKRKKMLVRWAEAMECQWFKDENVKSALIERLENETILPTPLNIKDFVMATGKAHIITNKQELFDIMNSYARGQSLNLCTSWQLH
jgi:hypothetical protein